MPKTANISSQDAEWSHAHTPEPDKRDLCEYVISQIQQEPNSFVQGKQPTATEIQKPFQNFWWLLIEFPGLEIKSLGDVKTFACCCIPQRNYRGKGRKL